MIIGCWGDLIFEVSGLRVKTYSEFNQETSARWVEHETLNSAPVSEFLGPGLDKVSLKLIFSRMLGVEPRIAFALLRNRIRKGHHFPLIIGGIPVSLNTWYAENANSTSETFAGKTGAILQSEVTVNFKEYH